MGLLLLDPNKIHNDKGYTDPEFKVICLFKSVCENKNCCVDQYIGQKLNCIDCEIACPDSALEWKTVHDTLKIREKAGLRGLEHKKFGM